MANNFNIYINSLFILVYTLKNPEIYLKIANMWWDNMFKEKEKYVVSDLFLMIAKHTI